jgi:hypothetical protein
MEIIHARSIHCFGFVRGPISAPEHTYQTFAVQYGGTVYGLTTEFAHSNTYINGVFYNSVVVIH